MCVWRGVGLCLHVFVCVSLCVGGLAVGPVRACVCVCRGWRVAVYLVQVLGSVKLSVCSYKLSRTRVHLLQNLFYYPSLPWEIAQLL